MSLSTFYTDTHSIEIVDLRTNDFEKFYENRSAELIKKIEKVMGKTITTSVTTEIFQEEQDEVIEDALEASLA